MRRLRKERKGGRKKRKIGKRENFFSWAHPFPFVLSFHVPRLHNAYLSFYDFPRFSFHRLEALSFSLSLAMFGRNCRGALAANPLLITFTWHLVLYTYALAIYARKSRSNRKIRLRSFSPCKRHRRRSLGGEKKARERSETASRLRLID